MCNEPSQGCPDTNWVSGELRAALTLRCCYGNVLTATPALLLLIKHIYGGDVWM